MKTLENIMGVLAKNVGMTIVLILAVLLFALFSTSLIGGLITAASAMMAFTCAELLYKEYKAATAPKPVAKPAAKKPSKSTKRK